MQKFPLSSLELQNISVSGDKGTRLAHIAVDTGASESFISAVFASQIATIHKTEAQEIELGDARRITIDSVCTATFQIGDRSITDTFWVLPNSTFDVILGLSTMRKYSLVIEMGQTAIYAAITVKDQDLDDQPASSAIAAALDLSPGATWRDCTREVMRLKERNARIAAFAAARKPAAAPIGDLQRHINKQLGISDELFRKFNPEEKEKSNGRFHH